jgi:endoglucanase
MTGSSSRRWRETFCVLVGLVSLTAACSSPSASDSSGAAGSNAGAISGSAGNPSNGGSGSGSGGSTAGASGASGSGGAGHAGTHGGASGAGMGGSAAQAGFGAGGGGATAGAAGSGLSGAAGSSGASDGVDAEAMVAAMGFGANIGNTLENTAEWETGWGQPRITQQFIDGMASRGIKTVRVPVAWDTYADDGVIAPDKLDRVKEVVSWIEAAGMYSIVNIHWDGGWIFNENRANAYRLTSDVKAKFESYWEQIASGFRDVGHKLILEGLNEEARFFVNGDPEGTPDIPALNELNQLFVDTVRAEGGYNATRALLIAGFQTDIQRTCVDAFSVPSDPAGEGKLFLSIHFYDPYTFTLMEESATWGEPAPTWGTDMERSEVEARLNQLGDCSASKNIPVILGEFAVTRGQNVTREPAARILWMESVTRLAFARGIVPVLWDTGSEINRSDGAFSSELQTVLNNVR